MNAKRIRLYGLSIETDLPVRADARTTAGSGTAPDLAIRRGPAADQARPITGDPILNLELGGTRYQTAARTPEGGVVFRIWDVCDFHIDPSLVDAEVRLVKESAAAMAGVLVEGALPAFVLLVRGQGVLHASAVEIDGRVLAFVGRSGMGKSTIAALTCQHGGRLFTDDVLRYEVTERCAFGYQGTRELRLRPAAGQIAASFPPQLQRPTCDGRTAVSPQEAQVETAPIGAVVVPRLRRDVRSVTTRGLTGADALLSVVRFPRFPGLLDPALQARQLAHVTGLANQVPIVLADLPWSQPPSSRLAGELLASLRETASTPYHSAALLAPT